MSKNKINQKNIKLVWLRRWTMENKVQLQINMLLHKDFVPFAHHISKPFRNIAKIKTLGHCLNLLAAHLLLLHYLYLASSSLLCFFQSGLYAVVWLHKSRLKAPPPL
uniref:Uncharacterized protein n=1 Tax=Opuntia streptacantha TaxID=393608 RepID=A0A7C9D535_OPUST